MGSRTHGVARQLSLPTCTTRQMFFFVALTSLLTKRMDDLNLNLPDTIEATHVGALVAAYAPELEPQPPSLYRPWLMWLVGTLVGGGVIFGPAVAQSVPGVGLILLVTTVGAWVTRRLVYSARIATYENTIAERPYELHEQLAGKFRGEIDAYRDDLLGDDTDWQRARAELRRASAEASSSMRYWADRWGEDPKNELALSHRNTASRLYEKLSGALSELDKREEALLTFFDQCEAKILILDRSRSDHFESQRLTELSQRSDHLVIDAALAIDAIGRQFFTRTIEVGQALGALERLQLKDSAGDIGHDSIELVAERILEAAQDEERALAKLVASVSG
jgi:hypothetical protein